MSHSVYTILERNRELPTTDPALTRTLLLLLMGTPTSPSLWESRCS